jgi:hypothetical protein
LASKDLYNELYENHYILNKQFKIQPRNSSNNSESNDETHQTNNSESNDETHQTNNSESNDKNSSNQRFRIHRRQHSTTFNPSNQ